MAFGKNENDLELVSAFRRAETELAKPTPRSNTKSRIPAFTQEYTPSTVSVDTVRLVPGEYDHKRAVMQTDALGKVTPSIATIKMPFIQYTKHFDGITNRGSICSAGPFRDRELRDACYGCDIYFATATRNEQGRYESSRMRKQAMYAFSVWNYADYHNAPQLDANGKVKCGPQGKPYMQWQPCIGQGCPGCRMGNLESKKGCMRAWPLNSTQYQVLTQTDKRVGTSCARCLGVNCIQSLGWMTSCCRTPVIDMRSTQLTVEEINKQTSTEHTCHQCKTAGMLVEQYSCGYCAQRGQQGVRASLFDVDLQVQIVVDAGGKKNLQVLGFSQPNVIPDIWKAHLKPLSLTSMYAPDSLDHQAKMFDVAGTTAGPQAPPLQAPIQPMGATYPAQQWPMQQPAPQLQQAWGAPPAQPIQQQPQFAPPPQQYPPPAPPGWAPQQGFAQPAQPQQQATFAQPPQQQYPQQGYGPPTGAPEAPLATPYGPRR